MHGIGVSLTFLFSRFCASVLFRGRIPFLRRALRREAQSRRRTPGFLLSNQMFYWDSLFEIERKVAEGTAPYVSATF